MNNIVVIFDFILDNAIFIKNVYCDKKTEIRQSQICYVSVDVFFEWIIADSFLLDLLRSTVGTL